MSTTLLPPAHRSRNPYQNGNIDVLNLLLERGSFAQNERGMAGLCEYMVSNRCSRFELIKLKCAIKYHCSMGRNPCSADLFRMDKTTYFNEMSFAAMLATAKYLHSVGCPIDDTTLSTTHAAMSGDLDLLKFLCSIGCPVDENTCRWAAMQAELECLQFLRSVDCPWDARTIADAHPHPDPKRTTTQLEVREWARANGCPEPPGPLTITLNFACECDHARNDHCPGVVPSLKWGLIDHAPFLRGNTTISYPKPCGRF
jgi:hypothetical protein